jgi:DMSO/TMAO reductase YedYZ molybdopterin-dependent catalytic subunit
MSVRLETPVEPASAGMPPRASSGWAALAGVVSFVAWAGAAEAAAVVTGPGGSPLLAVGSAVIDLAPAAAKDTMVGLFGTGDKVALGVLMAVVLVVVTGLAGVAEQRRPPLGRVVFGVGGAVAVAAVLTRAGSGSLDAAPAVIGTVVAVVVLPGLLRRLGRWRLSTAPGWAAATEPTPPLGGAPVERRSFLTAIGLTSAVAVVVGAGARVINAGRADVAALRDGIALPEAAVTAEPVPAGASLDVPGITPYVTSNEDFYRIDTALRVPSIDPAEWSLRIHGLVENEIVVSFDELLALPLEEHLATLSCVSNEVGGDLIGTALWLGHPIRTLLARAVPTAGADMVLSTSEDGFTAGTPLDVLTDEGTDALLAVGMNGQPLPQEHGFPVRMVVPGLFGYVSATKWVVDLEVTRFADAEGYWTPRGWDALGPVKLESRVDVPAPGTSVDAGTVPIAGVAWHPHTGVSRVEVQIDDEPWVDAELADSVSADTWVQWVHRWEATSGRHTVRVRATGADGEVQREARMAPAPNGAEGWDEHQVTVR